MKKVIEVSIGGMNFTIEDDAYWKLKDYLNRFESTIVDKNEAKEVMEDVEARVAEIFMKEKKYYSQVVDLKLVDIVISHLGEIETNNNKDMNSNTNTNSQSSTFNFDRDTRKFYRDPDDKKIAGVCSGLAAYFAIDVTLIRLLFLAVLIFSGFSLPLYIILWIATKEAVTVAQKLEMRGIPVTADNIRKFSSGQK